MAAGLRHVCTLPDHLGKPVMFYHLGWRIYLVCENGTFEVPMEEPDAKDVSRQK